MPPTCRIFDAPILSIFVGLLDVALLPEARSLAGHVRVQGLLLLVETSESSGESVWKKSALKTASAFAIGSSIKALANAQRINLHMTIQGRRRVSLLAHRDRRACIFRRCLWMRTSLITRAERAFFRVAFCMQNSRFSTAFLRT